MNNNHQAIQKKVKLCILTGGILFWGLAVYSQLICNQLVNAYDGLWEYTYHRAGKWELSLGRWFWLYIDKVRFGISNDPWTSFMTIVCFSAGMCIIICIFKVEHQSLAFLISALFISSPAVCVSLSYRFMSPVFGFAFLLSVLAVWVVMEVKKTPLAILLGSMLVALTMGLYQAYIGCTCIVIVGYLLWQLYCADVPLYKVWAQFWKHVVMLVLGGILYIILLNIHLKVFHVELSAYNGANTYSIWNSVRKLPMTVKNAYSFFYYYFFKALYKSNMLQSYGIYIIIFILLGCLGIMSIIHIWKKSRIRALCFGVMALVVPIACNAIVLIATDCGISIQMTAPLALLLPILICVAGKMECRSRFLFGLRGIGVLMTLLTLWGNVYQVQVDQNAMYEGKIATTCMAEEILHQIDSQGCLDKELQYCFVGIPAGNQLFYVSDAYGLANNYALIGVGWTDPESSRKSWSGIYHYFCGININTCSVNSCADALLEADIENMPAYPKQGYIKRVGDVVVVKVNE